MSEPLTAEEHLAFLQDRLEHYVFEDGSNGGDHIYPILATLAAARPSGVDEAARRLIDWLYDNNQSVDGNRVVSRASDVAVKLRAALDGRREEGT